MTVPPPINPIITIQPLTTVGIPADSASSNAVLLGAKHGDVIEGFVVNRDANQNPILRTPLGDILVKSDIFLKAGSEVQIRVDVQLASRARIITIDGQSPEIYAKTLQPHAPRGDVILQSSIISQQRTAAALPANTASGLALDDGLPTLVAVVLRQDNAPAATPRVPQTPQQPAQGQRLASSATPAQQPSPGMQVQVTILAGALPATSQHLPAEAIEQLLAPNNTQSQAPTAPQSTATSPNPLPAVSQQSAQPALPQTPAHQPQQGLTAQAALAPTGQPLPQHTVSQNPSLVGTQPAAPNVTNTALAPAASGEQASPVAAPALQQAMAPATLSNLSENDVRMLLMAGTQQKPTANALPPAINNPALAAQTLGQEDVPHAHTLQALPSSYRPFAGAQVIQQSSAAAPAGNQAATPPTETRTLWIQPTQTQPTTTATASATPPTSPPRGEVMQVIGHEPDGGTVLKGEHTTLKLFTAKPLPTGTQLTVEISMPTETRTASSAIPARLVEFSALSSHWPALDEAVQSLTQPSQAMPQQLSPAMLIPTVGPRLAHDVLLFLSVVRGGDVGKLWPTQILKQLEETKPDLLQRLQTDLGTMQQLAQPANPQQWAVYLVPLLFSGEAQQMRLFVRSDDNGKQAEDAIHNQRFIMEVALSNLGDMQLDGFVRGGKKPSHFDLVIRTVKDLPPAVEADISRLFAGALSTTQLKGQIIFQTGREHFIAPASHIRSAETGSGEDFTLLA